MMTLALLEIWSAREGGQAEGEGKLWKVRAETFHVLAGSGRPLNKFRTVRMILCAPAHAGIGDPQNDRYILQNGASQEKK
jgi:hypothetical protein